MNRTDPSPSSACIPPVWTLPTDPHSAKTTGLEMLVLGSLPRTAVPIVDRSCWRIRELDSHTNVLSTRPGRGDTVVNVECCFCNCNGVAESVRHISEVAVRGRAEHGSGVPGLKGPEVAISVVPCMTILNGESVV